jgi:hypothetical protein
MLENCEVLAGRAPSHTQRLVVKTATGEVKFAANEKSRVQLVSNGAA